MPYRTPDAQELCDWELAFNYVNLTGGNKTEAYRLWLEAHNIEYKGNTIHGLHSAAHRQFEKPAIKKYIEQFRAENRANYVNMKDENIAILRSIATDTNANKRDRIAATKELNNMCGYNSTNVNINGNISTDVVVEVV